MGFSDLGCYGSEISTPNLDGLAHRGVRFTQFYNTARCCPSRASPLTGLYPHQAGIGDMVENRGVPSYQGYLNDRCVTIAEALRQGGYRTLMSGKWHVGETRPHWPTDRGFDRYFGLISGASNYFRLDPGRQMAIDDQPFTPQPGSFYMTDAITSRAVDFLDRYGRLEKPFFLYVAYTAPHWPLTPPDPAAPPWDTVSDRHARDLKMAVYAAQIDRLDQDIGKLLVKLRQIGADENTLALFLSDNGGCAEEVDRCKPAVPAGDPDSFLSYGLPWANASNTPFRLYKHWVHEGGIATPLIACWPAGVKLQRIKTSALGHVIDLMATCLDVAGVEYPGTYQDRQIAPLEGRSLVPIFRGGRRQDHPALFWEHEGNRAVRQGNWKLVSRYPDAWELYDMEADRTEMTDLAAKYPEKARELLASYAAWARRCGVVEPKDLPKRLSHGHTNRHS
jgi:arylsulfatase A-like enzyme